MNLYSHWNHALGRLLITAGVVLVALGLLVSSQDACTSGWPIAG